MTSRERRLLHLALVPSGLPTASNGEGPRRYVVLYPEGHQIITQPATQQSRSNPNASSQGNTPDRARSVRNSFRRR
jgi:spoIIIJ-associated protein